MPFTATDTAPSDFKTRRTERFIERISDKSRRKEVKKLYDTLQRATGLPPRMWGADTIGFGRYAYETKGGRESEFAMTGISEKKTRLAVYLSPGYEEFEEPLDRLGKFEREKACITFRRLKDINLDALEDLVRKGTTRMQKRYKTWAD